MNKISVFVAATVAALLVVASPALAQKGKGKGGGGPANPGKVHPAGHGKPDHVRPFEHPNAGNSLPQSTLDRLPPGLRGKPESHPGVANHLRKLGDDTLPTQPLSPSSWPSIVSPEQAARWFAPPNTLPQEIRDQLPPGLRDKPNNHPGLANHLRKMGVLKDYPAIDPVPAQLRGQMPPELRNLPYDHPAVSNYLGRQGWSIDPDGMLIPPPTWTPFPTLTPSPTLLPSPTVVPPVAAPVMSQPFPLLRNFFRR